VLFAVFQGLTGSGKSYLGSALAKQACQNRYRSYCIRMPDLEESLAAAQDKPGGRGKWLRKNSAFALLVIDECLLDEPDDDVRSMLLELLERRYDTTSTVFRTKYAKKDWHQRLGSGVHADAIMDCIVHNTIWITTGEMNMREHGGSITECPDGERRYPAGDHRHDPVALKADVVNDAISPL
jgi:DNA replication protein DnaC